MEICAKQNPYQQWMERIQRVMKKHQASGWITVRCTNELSDDEDESTAYSQEEVDWIRCIILTPERELAIEEMTQLILGDQYDGHSLKMFNPSSFASNILTAFESMESTFKNKRMWSKKFNILFGFTLALQQYDSWMDDNDGGRMDGMINEICAMWVRLMKRSSYELAIDDEFSRPGIQYFVLKFEENTGIGDTE